MKANTNIRNLTLTERAHLVLRTEGTSDFALRQAYRAMARRHHPDLDGGDTRLFKLIHEAYALLAEGNLARKSLLADDDLVIECIRLADALPQGEVGRAAYAVWSREQFFSDW